MTHELQTETRIERNFLSALELGESVLKHLGLREGQGTHSLQILVNDAHTSSKMQKTFHTSDLLSFEHDFPAMRLTLMQLEVRTC